MAYYDVSNPVYGPVRRLESTDWNHADVFNATLSQMAQNTAAVRAATKRLAGIAIPPASWKEKTFEVGSEDIRSDSIVDVYFAPVSKAAAQEANIDGKCSDGALILTCDEIPSGTIVIDCILVRNEVTTDAG